MFNKPCSFVAYLFHISILFSFLKCLFASPEYFEILKKFEVIVF